MSFPILVDVEAVARRVVADPRHARFTLAEQAAVCGWVVRQIETEAQPLKASLAAALALTIAAHDNLVMPADPAPEIAVFEALFTSLKIRFEEEFLT